MTNGHSKRGITRRVIPSFYFSGEFSEPSCPGLADAEHPQLTIEEEAKTPFVGLSISTTGTSPISPAPFFPGKHPLSGESSQSASIFADKCPHYAYFSLEKISKLCYYTYQICTSRKEEDHETDPQLFRLYKPKAPPSRPAVDRWLFSLRCWLFGDFFSYPACCHHGAKLRYRGASAR